MSDNAAPVTEGARYKDWDWAQAQFENTNRSAASIARDIGVSHTAVLSRASRYSWTRDKGKQVVKELAKIIDATRVTQLEIKRAEREAIERVKIGRAHV